MWHLLVAVGACVEVASGFALAWERASTGNLLAGALLGGLVAAPEIWCLTNRLLAVPENGPYDV
jgi:hypothetical protein